MYANSLNNKIIYQYVHLLSISQRIYMLFFFVFEKKNIAINLADGYPKVSINLG